MVERTSSAIVTALRAHDTALRAHDTALREEQRRG
jgi:hypothetical protein